MNKKEYAEYEAAVADFFEREGINCLSSDSNEYEEGCVEPHFSWRACDCCNRPLGGDRYCCSGYNPETKEVQDGYSICTDCYYYAEYGHLDDMTMMEIDEDDEE